MSAETACLRARCKVKAFTGHRLWVTQALCLPQWPQSVCICSESSKRESMHVNAKT